MHLLKKTNIVVLFSIFILVCFAMLIPQQVLQRQFDEDEFQHVHIAWSLKQGDMLYRNILDHHGFLYAYENCFLWKFLHFPDSIQILFFLRWVNVFFLVGIVVVTFFIAQTIFGKPTAWLSSAFLISSFTFLRKAIEIRPDIQMNFWFLLALLLCLVCARQRKYYYVFACSLCVVIALAYGLKIFIPIMFCGVYFLWVSLYRKTQFNRKLASLFFGCVCLGIVWLVLLLHYTVLPYAVLWRYIVESVPHFLVLFSWPIVPLQFDKTALIFPLFYNQGLCEGMFWFFSGVVLFFEKNNEKRFFAVLVLCNALLLMSINKFAQWYMMAIPLCAVIAAAGMVYICNLKLFFTRKWLVFVVFMPLFVGAGITYYACTHSPKNLDQINFTQYVLQHTQRTARIFTIWNNHGGYMFRQHADALCYANTDWGDPNRITFLKYLICARTPDYVLLQNINPQVSIFLAQYFAPTEYPYFWGPQLRSLPDRNSICIIPESGNFTGLDETILRQKR